MQWWLWSTLDLWIWRVKYKHATGDSVSGVDSQKHIQGARMQECARWTWSSSDAFELFRETQGLTPHPYKLNGFLTVHHIGIWHYKSFSDIFWPYLKVSGPENSRAHLSGLNPWRPMARPRPRNRKSRNALLWTPPGCKISWATNGLLSHFKPAQKKKHQPGSKLDAKHQSLPGSFQIYQ